MPQNSPAGAAPQAAARKSRLAMIVGGLCLVAACIVIRYSWNADSAHAQSPAGATTSDENPVRRSTPAPRASAPLAPVDRSTTSMRSATEPAATAPRTTARAPAAAASDKTGKTDKTDKTGDKQSSELKIVAVVNREPISREQLAQECVRHYGKEVLESMINKYLILLECKRLTVTVSRAEVDVEIDRMAQRFGLKVKQWLQMLKQERGINGVQYASDIIWPTLALRKLAGNKLQVSKQELKEAFDAQYGEAVRARLISVRDKATAQKVRAEAAAKPEEFGELAKKYSEDSSASAKGAIPPIRKFGSFKEIEQTAFAMKDGEVSPVIAAANQYVILLKEGTIPKAKVEYEQVAPQLEEIVKEKKMREVAGEVFKQLQKNAKVENVFNDSVKSKAMPGVAAMINGRPISLGELAEQCVERHGEQVLEGTINRKLLEQACKRNKVVVSEKDIDEEIVRAAAEMLPLLKDKQPDVKGWIKEITEKQNISVEVYRSDAVWPSVALRKLVGNNIQVTEDDLKKGYEANYGPRVRCRAIVMNNARRAAEVWEKARRKPTLENFGYLAEQYSIEPGSQALRGEVPPIPRHGGQPLLEQEAFSLKAGDLSGIVQVGDKFIILLCEGYTKPVDASYQEVREEIRKDLLEKKLRLAMGDYFEELKRSAAWDNFLAGTNHAPEKKVAVGPQAPSKDPAVRPASAEMLEPRAGSVLTPKGLRPKK
jgi:parvulin-like peptidyl-prolyl isomerase